MLWQDENQAVADAARRSGAQMPSEFGEAFGAAFEEGQVFSQSLAHENASMEALSDYVTDIKRRTGQDVPLDYGSGEQVPSSALLWMQANDAVRGMKEKNPALDIAPLSNDEIEARTVGKSRAAVAAASDMAGREMTGGGRAGFTLGGLAAAATDPINIAAVPLAPEASAGILVNALRMGAYAAAAQGANEIIGEPFREAVQPGYLQSGAPMENVAGAFAGGAVLGGGFKALGNVWTRLKTGAWPTSIRDAGNVVESEANIQGSNVYPGTEGDAAHRAALSKAIDQILAGEPADVSAEITPAMEARAGKPEVDLQFAGSQTSVTDAVEQAMRRPIVETPMPSGANSSRDLNGPVYVDPRVPEPLRRPVAVHETVKQVLMDRGMPYEQAHVIATQAEKRAVEAAGMNWERYTHEWDGLLSGIEHEKVSELPPDLHVNPEAAVGHHGSAVKQAPIEQARQGAIGAAEQARAAAAPPAEAQPQLPFEATAAVERMRQANEVLAGGVQQIARRAGYDMPDAEAATIADKLTKATPAEADDMLRDLQISPRQVADAPIAGRGPAIEAPPGEPVPPAPALDAPDMQAALRADLDRERANADVKIPVGKDADGNVIYRGVDAALDEVDAYKTAADQIAACAAPEPAPAAKEAA